MVEERNKDKEFGINPKPDQNQIIQQQSEKMDSESFESVKISYLEEDSPVDKLIEVNQKKEPTERLLN